MRELRCGDCKKMLGEAAGSDYELRVKCARCKRINSFQPTAEMVRVPVTKHPAYEAGFTH